MRVRIARDELRRIRELSQTIKALEADIAQIARQLLSQAGFGPLSAAKLVGEIAGAGRFAGDAKLARAAGVAPIPVSSARPTATASRARKALDLVTEGLPTARSRGVFITEGTVNAQAARRVFTSA